jgi:hypothetical protein
MDDIFETIGKVLEAAAVICVIAILLMFIKATCGTFVAAVVFLVILYINIE